MDEEELQKRLTDCVYFLASPLTCKKGIECEYRHSEIARLNPRDCWYWLGGSCFNPDCAFRHPPLERCKETYCESANPDNGPAIPVNKTNIPCYFYSNGFCNKGDRCSFLHGPDDGKHVWKSVKAASAENNTVPSEKKPSAGSNAESHPDPSEMAQIEHVYTQDFQQLVIKSAERSESPGVSATRCQETVVRSDSLPAHEDYVQTESDMFTDQSSDQQADGRVEREEWLESSPGFDVLVEGESENLGYEEDADYFPVNDEEDRELNVQYVEYDPAYPELGNPLELERYDANGCLGNKKSCDYHGNGQSRESIFYRLSSQKRNLLQMRTTYDGQRGPDLRNHLKKRKFIDDNFRGRFSKRHDLPRLVDYRVGRNPRKHGSHGNNGVEHRGRFRSVAAVNRSRQPFRENRKHFLSSQVSRPRKPSVQQKRKSQDESTLFTGPKTLDQIKEEKKKALQNGNLPSMAELFTSNGFQGPRPLHEILKNKRKLGSVVDRNGNSN